jgi:hypothetical protein
MKYNTEQNRLINGEYGRNIQKMIEYCVEIKDRTLRNEQAKAIVRAMSHFAQGNKETEDFWHKLWDHLIVVSDFKLDVDLPFPKPSPKCKARPKPMPYSVNKIQLRPYGLLSEKIIKRLAAEIESPERDKVVECMANQLKRQYLNWNRDSVNDALIVEHLAQLSKNKLKLREEFAFIPTKTILSEIAAANTPPPKGNGKQAAHAAVQAGGQKNPNINSKKKKKKKTAASVVVQGKNVNPNNPNFGKKNNSKPLLKPQPKFPQPPKPNNNHQGNNNDNNK